MAAQQHEKKELSVEWTVNNGMKPASDGMITPIKAMPSQCKLLLTKMGHDHLHGNQERFLRVRFQRSSPQTDAYRCAWGGRDNDLLDSRKQRLGLSLLGISSQLQARCAQQESEEKQAEGVTVPGNRTSRNCTLVKDVTIPASAVDIVALYKVLGRKDPTDCSCIRKNIKSQSQVWQVGWTLKTRKRDMTLSVDDGPPMREPRDKN
ncbi:hypothetical protein F5Y13DRAFT_194014 [Hypoxylon sp. FL1857]|nr:hypothetical protein F5Y13DRAFT_194014 [Hypoxylon sp. FL1857]